MAGGGDGGMSLGGDGGGGGKGGGSGGGDSSGLGGGSSMFGGDPSLGGDSGFPGMDSGNAYTGDQAFGGPPDGSSGDPYANDPNVGAAQSQAPTPGTTPASIGGSQGPPQGQGYGGGSPTQQGQPQFSEMIQKAVKSLQGGGQQAGGQQGGDQASTAAPTNLTPSLDQLAKGGQQGQGFGGGSPAQQATNQTQLMPTMTPTSSVSPDQQPTGAIPGSQPTGPAAPPKPPAGGLAGPTGPGATPTSQPSADAAAVPRDPDAPPPDFSPKTGATSTESATGAPSGGGGGGQPSGSGGARGGGQPGAGGQGANPLKLFGDAIQALMGNPGPLLQDLAGQQAGASAPQGYDPTSGKPYSGGTGRTSQGTPPAIAPTSGSEELSKKPGGPDNPRVDPNDEQGKRRAEWYKAHDRTDPFPEDTFTPQGPTKEGGTLAGPGSQPGGGPVNWRQIAAMPASTHAQNFNQPFNSNLATDRARLMQEYDSNPALQRKIWAIGGNEQSNHPQGVQGTLETIFNRATVAHTSLAQEARWTSEGGYYDNTSGPGARRMGRGSNPAIAQQSMANIRRGSNISNYATDNSSNAPGNPLANREMHTGRFINQSQYGGEFFMSPGTSGNFPRSQWQQWMNRMNGGQQQQPSAPTTPQPAPTLPPRAGMQPNQQVAMNTRPPMTPQNDPDQSPENRPYMGPTRDDDLNNPGALQRGDPSGRAKPIPSGVPRPYGERGVDQASLASRYGMDWV